MVLPAMRSIVRRRAKTRLLTVRDPNIILRAAVCVAS
jgi:hypothetical protein